MSGFGGAGGAGGPGGGTNYGYYGPGDGTPFSTDAAVSSSGGGGSNLPVWALVLIMVGSGLITLMCLWLCVLFLCRKRRARRAAVRDLEIQALPERETMRMLGHGEAKEMEDHAKQCQSDAGVELTFVVMAGEDQPSYLARPAAPIVTTPIEEFEKELQKASSPRPGGLVVATTDQPVPENLQKTPPHHPERLPTWVPLFFWFFQSL